MFIDCFVFPLSYTYLEYVYLEFLFQDQMMVVTGGGVLPGGGVGVVWNKQLPIDV